MSEVDITRSVVLRRGDSVELQFTRTLLLVEGGPDLGMEVVLGDRPWVVGRGLDADVRLSDPAVSRRHLRIEPSDDGWRLVDLGSRSGTWVGDLQVETARLTNEAVIRLGDTELHVRQERAKLLAQPAAEFHGLVSDSPEMRRLFGMLAKVARLDLPVLLIGESGTGKENLARAVHKESARREKEYLVIDCTLLSGDHLRSELFGHVRGAFTGAAGDREGAFVRADGGTLVLDEVGELPLEIQPMLLRVLEQGEVRPLGGDKARTVRTRVLSSTNRNLAEMVEAGTFRRDLYHRLSAIEVVVPPLRERAGDAGFLAAHFLKETGARLSEEARLAMAQYPWPGNVRELRNAVQRAAALADGGAIRLEDLGLRGGAVQPVGGEAFQLAPGAGGAAATPGGPQTVAERTEQAIREAMVRHGGNRKAVAAELGISRTTLYRKLKKMGF